MWGREELHSVAPIFVLLQAPAASLAGQGHCHQPHQGSISL
jgi:hypothetical protein